VLEHFDEEVQERLKVHRDKARAALDERGRRLLALAVLSQQVVQLTRGCEAATG